MRLRRRGHALNPRVIACRRFRRDHAPRSHPGLDQPTRSTPGPCPPRPESNRELVALWIAQSASRHPRRNYARQAARFLAFVQRPLAAVRVGEVQAYLASLGDVSPATSANATAAIKSLF